MQPIKVSDIRTKSVFDMFDDGTFCAEIYGRTPAPYGNAQYNTGRSAVIKPPCALRPGTHSATIFTCAGPESYIIAINLYGWNTEDGAFCETYNARTGEITRQI